MHYLFDIDWRDEKPQSLKDRLLRNRILRAERGVLRRLANVSALSPPLAERIGEIHPTARRFTIPLGLDSSLYPFEQSSPKRPPTIGLIGSFNWGPSLRGQAPVAGFVADNPQARARRRGSCSSGDSAKESLGESAGEDVAIVSDVPDAIPHFRKLDLLLYAPPVGSGMKVKILEAFSLGTAVVTNSQGVEGLPALDGIHAGIADDDAGLIERAVALLNDPALREQRRVAARELVEAHGSPQTTLDAVERMYSQIADSGAS